MRSFIFIFVLLGAFAAGANEAKKSKDSEGNEANLVNSFQCEKFLDGSLGELKLKLIQVCNLDKPYSTSLSRTVATQEVYMYCCHKK